MTTRTLPPLLPCPFCGCAPHTIERPDNIDGTEFFFAVACYCDGHSATAHKMAKRNTAEQAKADASSAWNTRSATATLLERIAELEAGLEARIQGCEAMSATIAILERKLAQQDAQPVQKECWCAACDMAKNVLQTKMCVCPECGDKRCAKAMRHDAACSAAPAKVSESKPVIYSDEYGAQPAQQDAHPVAWHNPVATAVRDSMTGLVQLEYIGHFPADELVRLYAAPQPHHIDLVNVAVAVRDACHLAWVTSSENWRADVDVRQIVRDTHPAPKQVPLTDKQIDTATPVNELLAYGFSLGVRFAESAHRITGDKP